MVALIFPVPPAGGVVVLHPAGAWRTTRTLSRRNRVGELRILRGAWPVIEDVDDIRQIGAGCHWVGVAGLGHDQVCRRSQRIVVGGAVVGCVGSLTPGGGATLAVLVSVAGPAPRLKTAEGSMLAITV